MAIWRSVPPTLTVFCSHRYRLETHQYVREGAVNTRRYPRKQQVVSIDTHTHGCTVGSFGFVEMKATHVRVLRPRTGPHRLIMDPVGYVLKEIIRRWKHFRSWLGGQQPLAGQHQFILVAAVPRRKNSKATVF